MNGSCYCCRRRSTGTPDRRIAEQIRAQIEAAAWNHRLDGPEAHVTFANCTTAYLDAEKADRFVLKVLDAFKDTPIRKIKGESIRLRAQQTYPGRANSTLNRQFIKPAQAIINYGAELGWCQKISVKKFPEDAKIKVPALSEWVTAFSAQAHADGLPHLAALCTFMFGTGARITEALSVYWADVNLSKRTALIRQSKVHSERIASLPKELVVALGNIPSNRNSVDQVFPYAARDSVYQVWGNVIDRASIERLTPHCCRHGFATTMLRRGVDPKTVAYLGGWKDVGTVLKFYAHANEDIRLTDGIFDTEMTQSDAPVLTTIENKKGKSE